jgi:hypothetical protein
MQMITTRYLSEEKEKADTREDLQTDKVRSPKVHIITTKTCSFFSLLGLKTYFLTRYLLTYLPTPLPSLQPPAIDSNSWKV